MNTIDPIKDEVEAAAAPEESAGEPVVTDPRPKPTHEQIAALAYIYWLEAGSPESGMAETNWLAAEAVLNRQADATQGEPIIPANNENDLEG